MANGEVHVDEHLVRIESTEGAVEHLVLTQITVEVTVQVTRREALALDRRYPGCRVTMYHDGFPYVFVRVPLVLTDADVAPYLHWRDELIARVMEADDQHRPQHQDHPGRGCPLHAAGDDHADG